MKPSLSGAPRLSTEIGGPLYFYNSISNNKIIGYNI